MTTTVPIWNSQGIRNDWMNIPSVEKRRPSVENAGGGTSTARRGHLHHQCGQP